MTPPTVVNLAERRKQAADPQVVDGLRRLLARAEAGEITGYAIATTNSDGAITTSIEANDNRFAMSHALGALWFRFQRYMDDSATPSAEAP